MGQFRAKFKEDPNLKVVAKKCRKCEGVNAQVRKLRPGIVQFICTTCGAVDGVNQGGAVNL